MEPFVIIENRARGGLWWRIPVAAVVWVVLIAPIIATVLVVGTVRNYAADLPPVPRLAAWRDDIAQSSLIVAANGSVLAKLPFTDGELIGHRTWASFSSLPKQLVDAFLAAEDERFFSHSGIDVQAIVRAALANYRAGHVVEGASTITQQLARNLLPLEIGDERSARRKVREAIMARRIERLYNKREILEAYANVIFLGAQSYGVTEAARRYFGAELDELSIAQAALIAGLAQAPGRADPTVNPSAALARRNDVIERMLSAGLITAEVHASAIAESLTIAADDDAYGKLSPWITERVRQTLASEHKADYQRGGLMIETTAEAVLAIEGEARANKQITALSRDGKVPQAAAMVVDYQTGYVESIIGGRDFAESVFDRARQACRQPGSAFKPILYGAALEADAITPGTALRDGPIAEWDEDMEIHWKPQNSGRTFRGVALAQDAIASSLNAPAVDVLDRVGGEAVIAFARRLGITTKLVNVRPLALGASCVIPYELTIALATIANRGARVDPVMIKRIRRGKRTIVDRSSAFDSMLVPADRFDRIVEHVAAADVDAVIDEETAYMLTSMLQAVVARGTATAARAVGRPAAGKTGTTNDNSDAWFVGFTSRVVSAVWVGHDDPAVKLPPRADGSRAALPVWVALVRATEGGRPKESVTGDPPDGLVGAVIDRETGLLAEPGAGGALSLHLRRGTVPTTSAATRPDLPSSLERTTREF